MAVETFTAADRNGKSVTVYQTPDPATNQALLDIINELQSTLDVSIAGSGGGDLASETTLASVLTQLQSTLDVSIAGGGDMATETTLAALDTKVGSVVENPAAYTLLDRLAQIEKGLDLLRSEIADQRGYLDIAPVTFGTSFTQDVVGFEILTQGSVEIVTASGTTRMFAADTSRVYPIQVDRFTAATTIAEAEILAYVG